MIGLCGVTPVIVPCAAADGFRLLPAVTARRRWVVLNAPSNPSGALYSGDELRALAEVLHAYPDTMVLTDNIYSPFATRQGRSTRLLRWRLT